MIKIKEIRNQDKWTELGIVSLKNLHDMLTHFIDTCELNKIDPDDIPVLIDEGYNTHYKLSGSSLSFGKNRAIILQYYKNNEIDYYECEDKRPESGGEYWSSRGVGYDLAGFVVSREAGERILNMVKEVLNNDNPKSWLDCRKHQPNHIQFKFQAKEFDLIKLHTMTCANNNIVTKEILEECKQWGPD